MADSIVKSSFFWNGTDSYGQEELDAVFYASIRNGVNIYDDGTMGGQVTKGTGQVTVAPFIAISPTHVGMNPQSAGHFVAAGALAPHTWG